MFPSRPDSRRLPAASTLWPFGGPRFAASRKEWDRADTDPLHETVQNVLGQIPVDFGGGCPPKKAYAMSWLIRAEQIRASLDIGVYRGRSLMPQAVAHRDYTGGVAYGVDPYSSAEAMQYDNEALRERIREFIDRTDFQQMHDEVLALQGRLALGEHCRVVRKTSEKAAADFAARNMRFGLIHVDGNHDTAKVLRDVELYWPLLRRGGFLVMDDVSWSSVKPALDVVASKATLLFFESAPTVTELDYAVFWSGRSPKKAELLRQSLHRLREEG
jgi:hypothetical protein